MVLDPSAIVAILNDEPERRAYNERIEEAETCLLSAASYVEAFAVMQSKYGDDGVRDLDLFLAVAEIEIVPVDKEQALIAREAFRQFGKGSHPAGLNFGDCFSYALAKQLDLPLLFKGEDFGQTDIASFAHSFS